MINDDSGNVLFFTDSRDVFNGTNPALKINDTRLIGWGNNSQENLILKHPTNNKYYIIHNYDAQPNSDGIFNQSFFGLRYSIVDVNNNLPTMASINCNIPIKPLSSQTGFKTSAIDASFIVGDCLQAIQKVDNSFWIISQISKIDGTNYIGVFDFSINGTITLKSSFLLINHYPQEYGSISISPNGNKIIYSSFSLQPLIFDFDKFNGLLSQTTTFESLLSVGVKYFAFSPNSKFLYSIYGQMDIDSPFITRNTLSKTLNPFISFFTNNDKIYFLNGIEKVLDVVHQPNMRATSLNPNSFIYQPDIFKIEYQSIYNTIAPNFLQTKKATAYDVNQISAYKVGCGFYKFFPDVPANSVSPVFTWNFGDPNSGATNNTSSLNTPIHVFSGSGTYTVSLTYNVSTTITTQIVITTFTPPAIQGTSSVCFNGGNATTFNSVALLDGQTVVWTRTSGNGTILQNNQSEVQINWTQLPGTISATITDSAGCVGTVTKTIALDPNVVPTFNAIPANICNGSIVPVLPTTSNNGITGVWSPSIINNTTNGSYVFNPNVNNCATAVTVSIIILPSTDPSCSSTSCQPNLTLTAAETNTIKNYKYKNWIKTMTNYSISSSKDINMKAEDYLVFAPNTHIMSGAKMLAKIETCLPSSSRPSALAVDSNVEYFFKDIKIYPNPTTDIVNIATDNLKISKVMIASIEGKLIFEQSLNNETSFQFDLSNFTDGMYILSIETSEGKTFIKKLMKE